jgi:DNA repair protein endonuclease SAE2/CtIP C-terminus
MANPFEGWVKSSIRNRKRKARSSAAAAAVVAATATATAAPTPPPSSQKAASKQEHEMNISDKHTSDSGKRDSSRHGAASAFDAEIASKAVEIKKSRISSAAASFGKEAENASSSSLSSLVSPHHQSKASQCNTKATQRARDHSKRAPAASATTTTTARTRASTTTATTDVSSYRRLDEMDTTTTSSSSSPLENNDKRKKARLMSTTETSTTSTSAKTTIATGSGSSSTGTSKEKPAKRREDSVLEKQQQQQRQEKEEEQCNNHSDNGHDDDSNKKSIKSATSNDNQHIDQDCRRQKLNPPKIRQRRREPSTATTTTVAAAATESTTAATATLDSAAPKSTRQQESQEAQTQTQLIQRLQQAHAQLQKERKEENQAQTLLIQRLQTTNATLQKDKQQLKTRIKHLQLETKQLGQENSRLQQDMERLQADNQALRHAATEQRNNQNTAALQHVFTIMARQRLEMETTLQKALCPESSTTTSIINSSLLPPAGNDDGLDAPSTTTTITTTANPPVDSSRLDVVMVAAQTQSNHQNLPAGNNRESSEMPPPKVSLTSSPRNSTHDDKIREKNGEANDNRRCTSNVIPRPPHVTDVAMHSSHPLRLEDEDEDSYTDDFGQTQAISGPFKLSAPDAAFSPKGHLPLPSAPDTTTHDAISKASTSNNVDTGSEVAQLYCMPIATGTTPLKPQGSTNAAGMNGRKLLFEESSESSSSQEDSQATREPVRVSKTSKKNLPKSPTVAAAVAAMPPPPTLDSSVTLASKETTSTLRHCTITMDPVVQQKASPLVKIVAPVVDTTPSLPPPPPAEDTRRRVTMENPYTKPLDPRSIGRPLIWNQRPLGNSPNAAAHLPGSGWVSNQPARAFMKEMDEGVANSSVTANTNISTWVSAKRHTNRNPHKKKQVDIWDDESQQPEYKYHEVVRCKDKRNALPCYDCPDCREFYEYLRKTGHEFEKFDAPIDYSRHRSRFTPPETPDDFWEIDFIDEKRAADKAATEARRQQQLQMNRQKK